MMTITTIGITMTDMPARRGSTRQWRNLRAPWTPQVAAGLVRCQRCNELINPQERWHLGHRIAKARGGTDQPTNLHPEHVDCNLRGATTPAIPQPQTFPW